MMRCCIGMRGGGGGGGGSIEGCYMNSRALRVIPWVIYVCSKK